MASEENDVEQPSHEARILALEKQVQELKNLVNAVIEADVKRRLGVQ